MKGVLPEAFFSVLMESLIKDSLFFESNSSPCSIIPNGTVSYTHLTLPTKRIV